MGRSKSISEQGTKKNHLKNWHIFFLINGSQLNPQSSPTALKFKKKWISKRYLRNLANHVVAPLSPKHEMWEILQKVTQQA
jgi:hypothetical protein